MVAGPNFPSRCIFADALAGGGVAREFHRQLIRAERLADVEGIFVFRIGTVQAEVQLEAIDAHAGVVVHLPKGFELVHRHAGAPLGHLGICTAARSAASATWRRRHGSRDERVDLLRVQTLGGALKFCDGIGPRVGQIQFRGRERGEPRLDGCGLRICGLSERGACSGDRLVLRGQ